MSKKAYFKSFDGVKECTLTGRSYTDESMPISKPAMVEIKASHSWFLGLYTKHYTEFIDKSLIIEMIEEYE